MNKAKDVIQLLIGSAILAFGLYHIHSVADITEGGVLGLNLLLERWFSVSPAVTNVLLNGVCYFFGWKVLGKKFILYSAIATVGFSVIYKICEQAVPLGLFLYELPLLAAVLGALFVGVGAGLCVRSGGAPCGDDAFAMALSHLLKMKIQWVYLISDLVVLALSLTYIPLQRICYSLLTVVLSGQIIGWIQKKSMKKGYLS